MNDKLSSTANLLGDPGRAAILLRLMSGLALPAGELAVTANVAPQTASEHLNLFFAHFQESVSDIGARHPTAGTTPVV